MYANFSDAINPGTDIKVTPDSEAPIIPKATTYQGDCFFALKKTALESSLPVK